MKKRSPVIWLSGMSGSGKSTLSDELDALFQKQKYKIYVLDGDEIRGKDTEKLGFGYADVMINNTRIANLCNELRKEYDAIVVPVISPYNDIRLKVRGMLEPNFHLVYLKTDIQSLRDRDPKGLYAAADRGDITDLIGYSDVNPYDEPSKAEIVIETGNHVLIDDSKKKLFDYINKVIFIDNFIY
ncbi:MAG: adenylyl-sulfate kinase [Thiotrichales bacterium]|jgi:adenylylsulfate kinase|nr:adenylyl-sulfate kinase [Thiotrichales bacterium]